MPAKKYLKIALLLLLVAGIGLTGCNLSHKLPVAGSLWPEENLQTVSIKIKEETFELELALNSLSASAAFREGKRLLKTPACFLCCQTKNPFRWNFIFG